MNKIISYSLFSPSCGNFNSEPIRLKTYTQGVWDNLKLVKEIMPDWKMRVYINSSIDLNTLPKEEEYISYIKVEDDNFMFWRFYPWDDKDVDIFLSRDLDDRINYYDNQLVKIFESSDYSFSCARAHQSHVTSIMGGLWGVKPKKFNFSLLSVLSEWKKKNTSSSYMSDQKFLNRCIWPLVREQCISFGFYGDAFSSGKHVYLPLDKLRPHQTEAHLGATYGPQLGEPSRRDSRYEEHPFSQNDSFYKTMKNNNLQIQNINGKFYLELGEGLTPKQIEKL